MMIRVTVLLNSSREEAYFDEPLSFLHSVVDNKCPHICVKRATVFWNYNNISEEPAFSLGGKDTKLAKGYYTLEDINDGMSI